MGRHAQSARNADDPLGLLASTTFAGESSARAQRSARLRTSRRRAVPTAMVGTLMLAGTGAAVAWADATGHASGGTTSAPVATIAGERQSAAEAKVLAADIAALRHARGSLASEEHRIAALGAALPRPSGGSSTGSGISGGAWASSASGSGGASTGGSSVSYGGGGVSVGGGVSIPTIGSLPSIPSGSSGGGVSGTTGASGG